MELYLGPVRAEIHVVTFLKGVSERRQRRKYRSRSTASVWVLGAELLHATEKEGGAELFLT